MKTIKNETNDNSKKSSKKVLSFHYKQLTLRFGSNRNEKEKKKPALQKMTKKCYIEILLLLPESELQTASNKQMYR